MRQRSFDPSRNPAAHVLAVGSVLTLLVVGLVSLVAATPSWWRLLLVPLVVLPALTLRGTAGRLLAGHEDPWVELALAPAPVPAPVHHVRTSHALRYGVDTDVARAA